MMAKGQNIEYDDLLYIDKILKIEEYLNKSIKDFPYDYRYVLLKENISEDIKKKILKSYTDEELDMIIYILESNIYKTTFESVIREEDDIFNVNNDKKVLEKCNIEYKNRF